MRSFDAIVVGAGPAGEVAAGRLGERGLSVALVEEHLIGGECSFYACMPSKGLLRPHEALAETLRVGGAREAVTGDVDVQATLARRDEIIHDLDDSEMLPWLAERGVVVIRGRGRLDGEKRVRVGDEVLEARRAVVLATGSGTLLPPIDGLADARPWTNREATTAKEVPASLVVMGGGVVGVELSQAWQTLGSQVTLIEGEHRLLPREEEFACVQVTEALEALGVDIRTGRTATRVERSDGEVSVTLDDGSVATGHELLVAVGRKPRSEELGLDTIGVEAGSYVETDERMRVGGRDWLFAIGDLNGRALLTHMGKYQARIACDTITGGPVEPLSHGADGPQSPRVIFTDPQVAAVGHTEATAREAGLDVTVIETGTNTNAGGSFYGHDAPGTARLLLAGGRIVGATITGPEVADFLQAATIAVVGEVPVERLHHAVPAFPTRSELWLYLLEKAQPGT
jgi:pyruvate/2-oxoglutarate dehydrogenase complex dihydrolipoamide dehydrogenase (E3) component